MKKRKIVKVKNAILFYSFVLCLFVITGCSLKGKGPFVLKEHLDEKVVTINDEEFTLGDTGYYIANGEAAVEAQALVYSPDNPMQYWNKHTNGIFIKVQTRQNVINSFVRDQILAMEAKKSGISLDDNQKEMCKQNAQTVYSQLNDYQKEEAGITVDGLEKLLENAYLGQYYIEYRLENDGRDDYTQSDWQLDGVCYKGILSEYKVKIDEKLWEQLDFGKITINRE